MTITLTDIIRLLLNAAWRRRYMICVPIALMIPISILGARFIPKTFEAKTIVLLQEPAKNNPFLKDFTVGLEMKDRISSLQTLLKSEHVLIDVLKDVNGPAIAKNPGALALAVRRLSGQVSATLVGSNLIELRLRGEHPEGLGKMLAAISARFLEQALSPEQSSMGASRDFLKAQLDVKKQALEEAEMRLADFKLKNSDKLPAIYMSNVQNLGGLRQKLADKAMELKAADAAFQDIKKQLSGTNPVVGRLEEAIVQAMSELTSLRARYTPEHSEVQALERRLQRLREERTTYMSDATKLEDIDVERLWNMVAGHQRAPNEKENQAQNLLVSQLLRLQEAKAKRAALDTDVQQLNATITAHQRSMSEFSPIEQQQARLEKEVTSAREYYESYLRRYDNAVTSNTLGQFEAPDRVKVIDPPQDPTFPSSPPKIIFVVAGIFAGVFIGIGLAIAAEFLDQRVRTAGQFQSLGGVPVLCQLPLILDTPAPSIGRA